MGDNQLQHWSAKLEIRSGTLISQQLDQGIRMDFIAYRGVKLRGRGLEYPSYPIILATPQPRAHESPSMARKFSGSSACAMGGTQTRYVEIEKIKDWQNTQTLVQLLPR